MSGSPPDMVITAFDKERNLHMTLLKGQRVQTPLGPGTVLGFESFNRFGFSNPVSDIDTDGRIWVQLDDPSQWLGATAAMPHPYMFRSQLSELNEG